MGDVLSCLQGGGEKKTRNPPPKFPSSITHFLSIPTSITYSDDADAESLRYNFKHSFKSNRRSIFNSENSLKEIFSIGEIEFTIQMDTRGSGSNRIVAMDTYITSSNSKVTFLNGYIFIVDSDGKLVLYKMFSNLRHYNRPQKEKLRECPVADVHEKWISSHTAAIDFLFVGNILISPGYLNINEVELLTQKLKSIPPFYCGKKYLFDENQPDVIFQIGERKFYAHKEILVQRSKVFEDVLMYNTNENGKNILIVDDFPEDTIEEMLFFIYTDTCPKIKKMSISLLRVADKYGLEKLKLMIEIELTKIMDQDNVDDLLNLAKTYDAKNLFAFTTEFIRKCLQSVTEDVSRTELNLKKKKKKCFLKKAIKSITNK